MTCKQGFQQQDSHELLRVLLDGLQTEEAKAIAAKLKHNSAQQEEVEVSDTVTSPVTPQGFLSEVFGGQLSSRVACGSCDYTSVTLESFMDLSLPIPSASLAKLHTSEPDRRSKKKGKGMRAEDASESISHAAVRTEAQPSDKKLSPKQRRKLERTAMKLERKKQSKGGEAASAPQPASSTSDPASQPCTSSAQSEAQPRRTCAAPASDPDPTQATMGAQGNDTEANDNAQPQIAQRAESADIPAVKEEDATQFQTEVAATEMAAGQSKDFDKQEQQEQAAAGNQAEPHAEHAEPAEPHDVLHELEQLPQLPDMPKHDIKDDLAGLFQAAFATCHAEMSPRGAPPLSPFSAHGQGSEEEDYSLYEDADQAIDGNEPGDVAVDASDAEKEERSGEMAKPLLEGFMGDAVVTTLSDAPQDDADDDTCANIGSLFEEGANEESSAVLVSDYGAAEESDVAEREGRASEDSSLESCLHEFFHQEHISWECPGEKQAKKQLRRSSLGTDGEPPSTPAPGMGSDKADAEHTARRTVSFSEAQPVVTLIPGSVEQRGQVFRTSHGDPPFCRPLRLGGAFVLLTTAPDQRRPTRMQIKIQPQDEEEATLMLASNVRHLATADVPAPKVGDDEEEVRLAQAQVLMDCLADLLAQKGLDGSRAWCEGGLKLKLRSSEEGTAAWVVVGQLPPEEGQGRWEYPSPVDPSQPPSENEAAFASSEILRSSSDSSRSSSSSAAERRDSTDFGTLMESVCGSCPNSAQGSHAEAAAEAGEAQQDSRNSRTSLPEAHTSAAAAGAGGASSTAVADSGNISTTAAAGSDAVSAMAAGADASAATAAATGAERAHHGMEATAGIHTLSTMKDTSYASPLDGSLPPNAQETSRDIENAASEPGDAMTAVPAVAGHDSLASSADSCATSADDHQASDPGGSASVDSKQAESPICRADGEFATTAAPEPSSRRAELSSKATEPSSQVAESASKSSTTPPKPPKGGSPKKGGLVNVQRPAVKGYSIHRCPPLLTVHVKRFQQDMRGRLSKIDGAVPFPLHLDLTPFCDPKAVDRSAQYTLLGFVEHMGTMRSGHYVAYVQRGLNVSDSPHLQSLLHKHGIGPPPVTDQPSSSSMLASSKGKKKGAAKASLSPKVGAAKKEAPASSNVTTTAANEAGRVSASGKRSSKARSDSAGPSSCASAAEDSNDQQNSNNASQPTGDATASDSGGGFMHTNGHAQPQHSIPHNWESSDSSSADEASQAASSIPAKQANGTHMQTDVAQGASGSTSDTVDPVQQMHENVNGARQQENSSEESARFGEASTSQAQAQESAQLQAADPNGRSAATKKGKICTKEDVSQQGKKAWYYISDTQVKPVTEADVLSREAYILLYMRTA
ncbi:MAG: ubiquitin carboxyl-terminal hydrolase 2-like [Trebouxia sp. A1-2]|nr:MAG: ubiquitin carboxyl-terminal hydrolase 2-like [Trebouxia sp. A1-2]